MNLLSTEKKIHPDKKEAVKTDTAADRIVNLTQKMVAHSHQPPLYRSLSLLPLLPSVPTTTAISLFPMESISHN